MQYRGNPAHSSDAPPRPRGLLAPTTQHAPFSRERTPLISTRVITVFLVPFREVSADGSAQGRLELHFRSLRAYLWCNEEVLRRVFFTGSIYNHFKYSPFIDGVHSLNKDKDTECS